MTPLPTPRHPVRPPVDLLDGLSLDVPVLRMQTPRLPFFSPIAPTIGMPASAVDRAACYAGQSAMRMKSVTSARQAVADLAPGEQ